MPITTKMKAVSLGVSLALAGRLVAAEIPDVEKNVGGGLLAADEAECLGWIPAHHGSLFSHDVE